MNGRDLPKRDQEMIDQQTFFLRLLEKSFLARVAVLAQSVYFIAYSTAIPEPRNRLMFDVTWLPTGPAYAVAGLVGLIVLLAPMNRWVVGVWLMAVGLACVGRVVSVVISPDFDLNEKVRATGWVVQWMASLLSVMLIIGANALKGRRVWSG